MSANTPPSVDEFIDSIDPSTLRDGIHLREISAAKHAVESSQDQLRDAVRKARLAGDSWTMIGIALGTSKQNAYRKFGKES
jgi:hypothetical protein